MLGGTYSGLAANVAGASGNHPAAASSAAQPASSAAADFLSLVSLFLGATSDAIDPDAAPAESDPEPRSTAWPGGAAVAAFPVVCLPQTAPAASQVASPAAKLIAPQAERPEAVSPAPAGNGQAPAEAQAVPGAAGKNAQELVNGALLAQLALETDAASAAAQSSSSAPAAAMPAIQTGNTRSAGQADLAFAARMKQTPPELPAGAVVIPPEAESPQSTSQKPQGVVVRQAEGSAAPEPSAAAKASEPSAAAKPLPARAEPLAVTAIPNVEGASAGSRQHSPEAGTSGHQAKDWNEKPAEAARESAKPGLAPEPQAVSAGQAPVSAERPGVAPQTAVKPPAQMPAAASELDYAPPRTPAAPDSRHELSLLIPGRSAEGKNPVEVRVVERAGEVQVAVRTKDAQLAHVLREDLGQLVSRLESSGYRAETWHPAETTAGVRPSGQSQAGDLDGHDSPNLAQDQRGGSGGQSQQGKHPQQGQPEWVDALEQSIDERQNSIRSILHGLWR